MEDSVDHTDPSSAFSLLSSSSSLSHPSSSHHLPVRKKLNTGQRRADASYHSTALSPSSLQSSLRAFTISDPGSPPTSSSVPTSSHPSRAQHIDADTCMQDCSDAADVNAQLPVEDDDNSLQNSSESFFISFDNKRRENHGKPLSSKQISDLYN